MSLFFALRSQPGQAGGVASACRGCPGHGIGKVFSDGTQRSLGDRKGVRNLFIVSRKRFLTPFLSLPSLKRGTKPEGASSCSSRFTNLSTKPGQDHYMTWPLSTYYFSRLLKPVLRLVEGKSACLCVPHADMPVAFPGSSRVLRRSALPPAGGREASPSRLHAEAL